MAEIREHGRLERACDFAGVSIRTVKRLRKRCPHLAEQIAEAYDVYLKSGRHRRYGAKPGPSFNRQGGAKR